MSELMKESDHLRCFPGLTRQSTDYLEETEDRFREWADSLAQIIFELDERGYLTYSNRSAILATGYTREDIAGGVHVAQLVAPEQIEKLKKNMALIAQGTRMEPHEYLVIRKDKTSFPVLVYSTPVFENGIFCGIRGIIMDMSDRKTTEEALEASRSTFFNIVERMEEGIVVVDSEYFIRYVNSSASRFLGLSPGIPDNIKFPYRCIPNEKEEVQISAQNEVVLYLELKTIETEWQGEQAFLVSVRNISERKKSENIILENEANLQAMIDNLPHIAWLKDTEGRFVLVNREFVEKFHLGSAEAILGKTDLDLSEEGFARKYMEEDQAIMRTGKGARFEEIIKDGNNTFWVEVYKRPIIDSNGNTIGTVGFSRDLTQQREAEKLRVHLIAAVEQAEEHIILTDSSGHIEYVNPAFERVTGYSREEVIGRNPRFLQSGRHDHEFYKNLWETITSGRTWHGRFLNRRKDATLFNEEASITPIRDTSGEIMGFVGVKRDITEELRMQSVFQEMQKTEALGRLAGGIAHDFNNILTAIMGNASFAQRYELPSHHPVQDSMNQILRGANRARELVGQILTYSKGDKDTLEPIHLEPLILEAVKLLRASIPASVRIDLDFKVEQERDLVLGNAVNCHQIIMNLCTNAAQSLTNNKGTIRILLDNSSDQVITKSADEPAMDWVRLRVIDDGIGMAPEILEHIFDPYFTTRPLSEGTGLGLSVVRGIVRDLGGLIHVESVVGQGSEFIVLLPLCPGSVQKDLGKETGVLNKRGNEHIMLVDDEPSLTRIMDKSLKQYGYSISTFNDPEIALNRFRTNPGLFDLLVCDMVMPKMRGEEFAQAIRSIRPEIPIFLITGFKDLSLDQAFIDKNVQRVLKKPVMPEEIHQAIRLWFDF